MKKVAALLGLDKRLARPSLVVSLVVIGVVLLLTIWLLP